MRVARVTGDLYNIAAEVQAFDPHYFLKLNEQAGKYQVVERRPRKMFEGFLNGTPLFSCQEVEEVVMTIDYIDAAKEPPDMRIVYDLRERDIWRHPRGAAGWYDDMMRDTEKRREKREAAVRERERQALEERHKYIVREFDGMPDLKTYY